MQLVRRQDASEKLAAWRRHYNEDRGHSVIGNIPVIMLLNSAGATSPPDLGQGGKPQTRVVRRWLAVQRPPGFNPRRGKRGVTSGPTDFELIRIAPFGSAESLSY